MSIRQSGKFPVADIATHPLPQPHASGKHPLTGAAWRVFCGDAKQVVAQLPADHYSSVITSPPYYWQRDYGVEGQIGMEATVQGYVDAICGVMDGVKRVMTPRGVLFLNLADTYYSGKGKPHGRDSKHAGRRFQGVRAVDKSGLGPPKKTLLGMPWRVALAMIDRNWILRSSIIWKRGNPVPESSVRDRPWRTYEHIFMFSRNRAYDFKRAPLKAVREEDVWTIKSQSKAGREHPAVFPRELVKRCLEVGHHGLGPTLDPFAGSGTVLRVAVAAGIPADGVDLSPAFCASMADLIARP